MRGLRAFMSSMSCFISGRVSGTGRGSSARAAPEPTSRRPVANFMVMRTWSFPFGKRGRPGRGADVGVGPGPRAASEAVLAEDHQARSRGDRVHGVLLHDAAPGGLQLEYHVVVDVGADELP